MLNEFNLLAQNIQRLIEINSGYLQDLHELQQRLTQICTTLEQARSERDTWREKCETLRQERNILSEKIKDTELRLNEVLGNLHDAKPADHQPELLP